MYVFVVMKSIALPLLVLAHPHVAPIVNGASSVGVQGGFDSSSSW